jgi:predicted acetyltransferase
MFPSDLQISKIGRESEILILNLFDDYVDDMAEWFEIPTGADGRYIYDTSLIWGNGEVYLAKIGDSAAGFAIAGSAAEWSMDDGTHDVREFFVVRSLRRTGVGKRMATLLWNELPGDWLVRVLELNAPAVLFWRNAISSYTGGSQEEERRIVNGRPWRFFRFVSDGG